MPSRYPSRYHAHLHTIGAPTAVVLANCGGIGYTVTLGFRPDGTWEVPSRNNDVQGFTVRQLAATLF